MRAVLLILAALQAGAAQAQAPAIGRLFTTPQERYQLDVARGLIAPPAEPPAEAVEDAPAPPAPVTFNGVVRRSSGHATVWLNGSDSRQAARQSGARISVTLPSGEQVRIKPGQTVDMHTGAVLDVNGMEGRTR